MSSSAATSTITGKPSARTIFGAGVPGCFAGTAVFCGLHLNAARRTTTAARELIRFNHVLLLRIARDEIVLLRVVAKRPERHLQELRCLRLHSTRPLERLQHED